MIKLQVLGSGYPVTNQTLRKITDADEELMKALTGALGDLVIITGVELIDGVYTNGYLAINGEILHFTGGEPQDKITVNQEVVHAEYNDDNDNDGALDILPVYLIRTASFGSGGVTVHNFSDFTRLLTVKQLTEFTNQDIVIDSDYVHTDFNFTEELRTRLLNLVGNIQADWSAVAGAARILNKPTNLIGWLKTPLPIIIGDVYTDLNIPIAFPNIGTSQYLVVGNLISVGSNWNNDNDVIWMARNLTSTGFQLLLKEVTGDVQNLRFIYGLIAY